MEFEQAWAILNHRNTAQHIADNAPQAAKVPAKTLRSILKYTTGKLSEAFCKIVNALETVLRRFESGAPTSVPADTQANENEGSSQQDSLQGRRWRGRQQQLSSMLLGSSGSPSSTKSLQSIAKDRRPRLSQLAKANFTSSAERVRDKLAHMATCPARNFHRYTDEQDEGLLRMDPLYKGNLSSTSSAVPSQQSTPPKGASLRTSTLSRTVMKRPRLARRAASWRRSRDPLANAVQFLRPSPRALARIARQPSP